MGHLRVALLFLFCWYVLDARGLNFVPAFGQVAWLECAKQILPTLRAQVAHVADVASTGAPREDLAVVLSQSAPIASSDLQFHG